MKDVFLKVAIWFYNSLLTCKYALANVREVHGTWCRMTCKNCAPRMSVSRQNFPRQQALGQGYRHALAALTCWCFDCLMRIMLCKRAFSQGKGLTDEVHVLRSENEQLKTELSKACGHIFCVFVVVHASWDGSVLYIIPGTKWARRHHSQTARQTWGASFLNSKSRSKG